MLCHRFSLCATLVLSLTTATAFAQTKVDVEPKVSAVKSTSSTEFDITYQWIVKAPPKMDWKVFVHFTDDSGEIKFQDDHDAEPAPSRWKVGEFTQSRSNVSIPEGMTGTFDIRIGLYDEAGSGDRALLNGKNDEEQRVLVGKLKVTKDKVEFVPNEKPKL